MEKAADESLVTRTLEGDDGSFERLVAKYQRPLFNAALRMLGNTEDARDVTQTTFVKAYEKLDTYDPQYKFFSWIYRILINESRNLLNRNNKKGLEPLENDIASPDRGPEDDCFAGEIRRGVQAAIMRLAPNHRDVIVLRHFSGFSYREMSYVLGIPEKTVKSRLFEARRKLCEALTRRGFVGS